MSSRDQDPLAALFASRPALHTPRFDPASELARKRLLARLLQRSDPVAVRLGRFEVVRCIGRGGMGTVFEAVDGEAGGAVALKIIEDASEQALARLQREFRVLCDLGHPHLVAMYELHVERGLPFFTMELIRGPSLSQLLRSQRSLSRAFVERCLSQLTSALSTLHARGVLHGDVKPQNLLVAPGGRLVVVDFGVARALRDAATGGESGTVAYCAPERLRGEGLTPAGDWYAVGVVLQELLDRVRGSEPAALARLHGVSRGLLRRAPGDRFGAPEIFTGVGAAPQPAWSIGPTDELGFVGRSAALEQLRGALRVARQRAVVCTVQGEAGAGKTALVEYFLALPELAAALVLRGRCYEAECLPYRGVDGLIEGLTGYLAELGEVARSGLAPADTRALLEVFPRLRQSGLRPAALRDSATTAQQVRRQAFEQLIAVLAAIARQRPLVIFLDDLQWADADGAAFLGQLVTTGPAGLLLLAGLRSDAEGPGVLALAAATTDRLAVELGPLEPEACHQLTRVARGDGVDRASSDGLLRESAGNPLLLLALLYAHGAPGEQARTYAQLVTQLIEALDRPARELLVLVVLAGRPIGLELLKLAASRGDQVRRSLSVLRTQRMLRTVLRHGVMHLVPHHDRLRELVTQGVPDHERQALHARIAHAACASSVDDPEFLAHHYFHAGDRARAGQQAERAGDQARATMALSRASELYQRALECAVPSRPVGLIEKLADVAAAAGDLKRAGPLYIEAAAARPGDSWALRLHAAEVMLQRGAEREGMRLLRPALREGCIPASTSALRALWTGGISLARSHWALRSVRSSEAPAGTPDDARTELAFRAGHLICLHDPRGAALILWSAARALSHGSSVQRGRALASLAFVHALLGLSSAAEQDALIQRALTLTAHEPLAYVAVLASKSLIAFGRSQCEEASKTVATIRAMSAERRLDAQWMLGQLNALEASVCVLAGDFLRVREFAATAEREARELGNRTVLAQVQSALAWSALAAGDSETMRRYTLAARAEWRAHRLSPIYGIAVWGECSRLLYEGDASAAHALMQAEASRFVRSGLAHTTTWSTTLGMMWGSVELTSARRAGDAHSRAARAHAARLEGYDLPVAQACAALLRAGLARRAGRTALAREIYGRARRAFAALGMRGHAAAAAQREVQLGATQHDEQALAWFSAQSVVEPSSWLRVCAP